MKYLILLILLVSCSPEPKQAQITLPDSVFIRNVLIFGDSGDFKVSKGITIINAYAVYQWHGDSTIWEAKIDSVTLYPDYVEYEEPKKGFRTKN